MQNKTNGLALLYLSGFQHLVYLSSGSGYTCMLTCCHIYLRCTYSLFARCLCVFKGYITSMEYICFLFQTAVNFVRALSKSVAFKAPKSRSCLPSTWLPPLMCTFKHPRIIIGMFGYHTRVPIVNARVDEAFSQDTSLFFHSQRHLSAGSTDRYFSLQLD